MLFFYIIIGILFLFILVVFLFDFIHAVVFMCHRYHIGRWPDPLLWEQSIEKMCFKWLLNTPNVRCTDKTGYLFLDIVKGNSKSSTIQSWQMAGLMLGIASVEYEKKQDYLCAWKRKYISKAGDWNMKPQKVDAALLSYAMLRSFNKDEIKPAMDGMISIIEQNLCMDGMVSYSQGTNSQIRFVDTLGMICPFLALYGKIYHKPVYTELAYNQIIKFRELGILENTELPCHAFHAENGIPLGVYGWGRGTGWYMLSLIETYQSIDDTAKKKELRMIIHTAAERYLAYQKEDGGFHTILQGGGQYDSSATVLMAYFYICCYRIFKKEPYLNAADKAITKIKTVTMKNGAIDQCQGDTHGIGIFSREFDILPFAQGIMLLVIRIKKDLNV